MTKKWFKSVRLWIETRTMVEKALKIARRNERWTNSIKIEPTICVTKNNPTF